MSDQFYAEIRLFPFNFPPRGWAFCDGQLMSLAQNTALFSLLGTTYGGDGRSNFALPNLQGSVPLHIGGSQPGPGLSNYVLGETGGNAAVPLTQSELPAHNHPVDATVQLAAFGAPGAALGLGRSNGGKAYASNAGSNLVALAPATVGASGGNAPHNNLMPYLTLNFCIALQGIYPSRS